MRERPATAALVPRIVAGDGAAFAAFYEAWFEPAFALARTIGRRDESFCLDVVQDAMGKIAAGAMPALAGEDAVAAWMSKAVWSATVDRLRAEQRRARRERTVATARAERDDGEPWRALLAGERDGWLQAQLAALSAGERALLLDRFGGERTLSGVGERFGISGDAAHGRIRRILSRLRKAAEEWFGE